jgi:hypothetical protein
VDLRSWIKFPKWNFKINLYLMEKIEGGGSWVREEHTISLEAEVSEVHCGLPAVS